MQLINTSIISSPYNWATVLLMAVFGLAFVAVVFGEE